MPNPQTDNVTYALRPVDNPHREIYGPDPADVVVGWDAGRATFFAHVSKDYPYIDGNSYRAEAVRIGTAPYEVNTAGNALNLVRPWAVVPPGLERELEAAAGPHRDRRAVVWSTNEHPGHMLAGTYLDLGDPGRLAEFGADNAPESDTPEWTVRISEANVYAVPDPGSILRQWTGLTRSDALLTAVRLTADPLTFDVSAFLGDDDRTASHRAEWRFDEARRAGWRLSGTAREQTELRNAIDHAVAVVVDGIPVHVAYEAAPLWQDDDSIDVTALAELVWRHGYWPAYRDAHTSARSVLNAAASLALDSNPRAAETLRRLRDNPDPPARHTAPLSEDAVIAARLATLATDISAGTSAGTGRATAGVLDWQAAADAAWHVSRAAARHAASHDAAVDFLAAWRRRGGEAAAANVKINRQPATDVIPDLIYAVCRAPRSGANWAGRHDVTGTPIAERLARDLLASVSNPADTNGRRSSPAAGVHPAALAGTFHPEKTAAGPSDAAGKRTGTGHLARHSHRDTPPGRHRATR